MKKIFLVTQVIFLVLFGFGQNISTGVAIWKVTPTGNVANVISPNPQWQNTPISGTGAKWISPTTNYYVTAGNYSYETIINVGSPNGSLRLKFQVAVDDVLTGLELEDPNGATIKLSIPTFGQSVLFLSNEKDTTINCPKKGEWKLRAKVKCDVVSGFLLSGNATLSGDCFSIKSTCCPPWNKEILASCITPKFVGSGLNSPYQLVLNTSATVMQRLNAYVNYLYLICPNQKFSISFEVGKVSGPNQPFVATSRAVCTSWIIFNTSNEPVLNNIVLGSWCHQAQSANPPAPPTNPSLQPNQWYVIQTYLDNSNDGTTSCIGNDCKIANIWIRMSTAGAKAAPGSTATSLATLEISDGINIISK
jgi:hypothetical protein